MKQHVDKRDYVRARKGERPGTHTCHWPGCTRRVPPAMWGCYRHWMMLPKILRDRIWSVFRPGQEIAKNPSRAYVAIAREVQDWIEANHGRGNG